MSFRRLQYNIDYIHILTFREEYKQAILPFFGFEGLRYGIDNENTIHESIRLIFPIEYLAFNIRKEGVTVIYEGDISKVKNTNGVLKIFWDIFENIKSLNGFKKTTKHSLILHDVNILKPGENEKVENSDNYLKINPFGKLDEFACVYEFQRDTKSIKFEFGNYSQKDISKHDLRPFKTEYTNDLVDGVGLMSRTETKEDCDAPSFTKFKNLLTFTENLINNFII